MSIPNTNLALKYFSNCLWSRSQKGLNHFTFKDACYGEFTLEVGFILLFFCEFIVLEMLVVADPSVEETSDNQ